MPRQADSMLAQLRREGIADLINAQGSTTVRELSEVFNVTTATIRSDLLKLEDAGVLTRTYGGAVRMPKNGRDPTLYHNESNHVPKKQAIARAALEFIESGDVIGLDIGSTTFQLCRMLGRFERLTVVTCDLQIATWLEYNTNLDVIVVGGQVDRVHHCTCGRAAREALAMLHLDKLFLSASGVSVDQGLSSMSLDIAEIKATMIGAAEESYLLCDSSKMGRKAIVSFAPLASVDWLVTDTDVSAPIKNQLDAVGATVHIAG